MTALAAPIIKIPTVLHEETGICLYALQAKQFEVFQLTPIYWAPHTEGPRYIACGGSAGGGKSYLARTVLTAVALGWPGSSAIVFRGTENEIEQNHVQKFLLEVPPEIDGAPLYRYNGEKMALLWDNGSRSKFGFLRTEKDVQTYLGAEYDCMIFDEATTYTDFMVSYLIGNRLRSTVRGTTPFALFPSNPGNRGHHWYKRWFIERRYRENERPADYTFVQMFLHDNQELMQRDPSYARKLDLLPEPWRSWQRDGNWQAGAGTALPALSYQRHVIKPFEIPAHWRHFGSFDWGYNHPWSFGDYYVNEDGRMFCRETLRGHHMKDHTIAETIAEWVGDRPMGEIVAGHDAWAEERAHAAIPAPTVADVFLMHQLYLVRADIARVNGYRQVRSRLEGPPPHDEPNLVFFDTPRNRQTIANLETMVTDERNPEDVLKVDADEYGEGGDDDYDQVRYACSHQPTSARSGSGPTFSLSSPETLAAERERLYRRRTDLRSLNVPPPPAFGEDYND